MHSVLCLHAEKSHTKFVSGLVTRVKLDELCMEVRMRMRMVILTVFQELMNRFQSNHRQVLGRSPSVSPSQLVTILSNLDTLCTSLGCQTLQSKSELKEAENDSFLKYDLIHFLFPYFN